MPMSDGRVSICTVSESTTARP